MPQKLVLSVNAGSSSLKISLYSVNRDNVHDPNAELVSLLLTASISGISSPPAKFSFKPAALDANAVKDSPTESIKDHASAFAHFVEYLRNEASIDANDVVHICHRIVHGGDYHDPVVINNETYHHIEKLSDLAPLHNGSALAVVKSCINDLPNANSIAFFDTAFHRSMPPHIASYPIDQATANKRGLKKYGFHGLSYAYILRSVSRFLERPPESLNLIVLHLGSGASVCAIQNGKSLDTSMGLTPVSGLPGATRSGAIDPSLIFHYTNKAGRISHDPNVATNLHVTQAEHILNIESGWKCLTGTTDFGAITQQVFSPSEADPENKQLTHDNAKLAFDIFTDRIVNYIGSYHLKLRGEVDALVFAGGIGEKSKELREFVGDWVGCIGYGSGGGTVGGGVDKELNTQVEQKDGAVIDISLRNEKKGEAKEKRILVCRTDEQFEMAWQCAVEDQFWN
uniref:Probable acetate kinase n=1 Tax=Moniliophthora roreri TaxID=221103 RepID=A0A0W0EXN9_MONRR